MAFVGPIVPIMGFTYFDPVPSNILQLYIYMFLRPCNKLEYIYLWACWARNLLHILRHFESLRQLVGYIPIEESCCCIVLQDHYSDVIMGAMAFQITSLTIVYSTLYSNPDQRKHESSTSLAFVRGIHRSPVNSPHKWTVTWKMFPFDDVIKIIIRQVIYIDACCGPWFVPCMHWTCWRWVWLAQLLYFWGTFCHILIVGWPFSLRYFCNYFQDHCNIKGIVTYSL